MEIQKLPQVNESISSAFTQFQNVQPLVYDNALSPYETISKLLWWVKSLTATTNQIIDELDKHEQEYAALKEQVNGINTRLTTAEQEINNAKERLDGHDDDIAEINADLQEIHQTITSIQNDITTLQGRCTEIENRLDGHDAEIQNLKDKDTDLQSQITSNDEDITKLQEKDTDLENQIHSNDTDISNLQQKDTELQAQITANKKSIDTINTQIIEINGNIDTINSNIDNLQAQITSNDSDITALQGETKQLKTDLTNLSTHVDEVEAELQRQITDNDTDISDLQNRMKVVETDVATLKTNVSNLQLEQRLMGDNITVIQNTINTINNNIESINDNIDTINNTLTTIQSNVEQNRQDIVDLTGKVTTNTNEISSIKEQIAGLDVAAVKQEIADIQSDITELQSGQADLLKQIQSNDTDIDNLKSADTALQNSITTINQRIETVENSIATLETQGDQNITDITELKEATAELKKTAPSYLHVQGAGVVAEISKSTSGNKPIYLMLNGGGNDIVLLEVYNPPISQTPKILLSGKAQTYYRPKYKIEDNVVKIFSAASIDIYAFAGENVTLHHNPIPVDESTFTDFAVWYINNIDVGVHFYHALTHTKYQNVLKVPFNSDEKYCEFDVSAYDANASKTGIAKYRITMQSSSGEIAAYLICKGGYTSIEDINNKIYIARPAGTNQPYYIAFEDNWGADVFVENNKAELIANLEDTSILENATHPVIRYIDNINTTAIDTKIQTIETEQESLESRVTANENGITDLMNRVTFHPGDITGEIVDNFNSESDSTIQAIRIKNFFDIGEPRILHFVTYIINLPGSAFKPYGELWLYYMSEYNTPKPMGIFYDETKTVIADHLAFGALKDDNDLLVSIMYDSEYTGHYFRASLISTNGCQIEKDSTHQIREFVPIIFTDNSFRRIL